MDPTTTEGTTVAGREPLSTNPLVDWILGPGWTLPTAARLTGAFAEAMVGLGVPLFRLRVTIRTLHPQYLGTSYTWFRGQPELEAYQPPHEIVGQDRFLKSPYAPIFEGAGAIRRRLDRPGEPLDFPILEEIRALGATDYVAMPLVFTDGRINAITFATDRPGGFSSAELQTLNQALPVLARLYEVHALRRTAETVLTTYLGRRSGARVLQGLIRRGDGETIEAVIWFSDLRASTALADTLPPAAFLEALNDYFGAVAGAVLDHGGEVLSFIGDAALSIFPVTAAAADLGERQPMHARTAATALAAARSAITRMAEVNAARSASGKSPLHFGIGLHLGEVLYGNIGTPERLEFTVVGRAANEAARIEGLCKTLDQPLLMSAEFAGVVPERVASLGCHVLRGVRDPREVFAPSDR
jgi:adenylate cyclase